MEGKLIGSEVELKDLAVERPFVRGYWVRVVEQVKTLKQGMAWKVTQAELPPGGTISNAKTAIRIQCRKIGMRICIRSNRNSLIVWKHDDHYFLNRRGAIIRIDEKELRA